MKQLNLIFLLLCFSTFCKGQLKEKNVTDSILLASRAKADKVLKYFDDLKTSKILYSLDDRYFYLIFNDTPFYKEYYVALDRLGNVEKIRNLTTEKKTYTEQRKNAENLKLIADAEPIFDLSRYNTLDSMSSIPNIKHSSGRYSYFVIQNKDGKIFGEYRLSAITSPFPINENLWMFFVQKLSEEISKDCD